MDFKPAYLTLTPDELRLRADDALRVLADCQLCPRRCHADRLSGRPGACRIGALARMAAFGPHHGEEAPLSGWAGSGTVFFSGCNLRCVFCQNADISQAAGGAELTAEGLADIFLNLQQRGCHNLNLVSPTHIVPQFIAALAVAVENGFKLPVVYNTGGYDALVTLRLLDGLIDIYMPDMKYADDNAARRYSGVSGYPSANHAAVREMHRQVGDLVLDENGLAVHGLLIRHLVLPGKLAGTPQVARFIAREISPDTYVNLMDQYHPCWRTAEYPQLDRPLTPDEFKAAETAALRTGLTRFDHLS